MKTAHTPGPWKAVELDEFTVSIKTDRNYVHECIHIADAHVMTGNLGEEVPRAVANAKLISAAPDLLEALKEAYMALYQGNARTINEVMDRPDEWKDPFEKRLIEAIRKAS